MVLFLFQIRNTNIPPQREADKHDKTACNKHSPFMPRNNPTSFFFGFSFLPGHRKLLYLPLGHRCHSCDPAFAVISGLPCIELLLSLLTGMIRKQGPLTQAGLSHPCTAVFCLIGSTSYRSAVTGGLNASSRPVDGLLK